jgi:hypothetical protein
MAIAYKSQGAGVVTEASGGALSPLCPATVDAGDILIAHCAYEGTTTTPDTPANWTLLGGPYTVESAYRHWIFGKIADGTEDGAAVAFGTPAVTTLRVARVYSFSGRVDGTITALVPAAGFAHLSHATDPQMPTVATSVAGALAVACTFQADDNPQASATGATGGTWAEAVAEYIQSATTPDTALHIQTCTPTSDPGTVTGGSVSTLNDPCGVIGFQIKPTAAQTVSPSAITTGEGFGTAKLNLTIFPSGVVTAEAFGTATVNQKISPSAIGSAEAFGTAELTQGVGGQTVNPDAIASAEALGTVQLNLTIYPSSIAGAEAFGTTKVNQTIAPSGIASLEAFGTPSTTFTISTSGIASAEAFGTPALNLKISPSGIASLEAFGSAQFNLKISPAGIASGEAFGTASLAQVDGIAPTGIPSAEAFGTPRLMLFILPASISSAEAFGTTKAIPTVGPAGIASAETFGSPRLNLKIFPAATASAEGFGTPKVNQTISPVGIPSAETFGSPLFPFAVRPAGIASLEAFGTLSIVTEGPQVISVPSITTEERFGHSIVGRYFSRSVGGTVIGGMFPLEQSYLELNAITQLKSGRSPTRKTITIASGTKTKIQLQIMSQGKPFDLGSVSAELKYFKVHYLKTTLVPLSIAAAPGVLKATVDAEGIAPGEYFAEVSLTLETGIPVFAPAERPLTLIVI